MMRKTPHNRDHRHIHRAMYLMLEGDLLNHLREAQIASDAGDCKRVWQHHEQAQTLLDALRKAHTEISEAL
ncbi:MAG: hypothetical protein PHE17_17925 [Thiothrix sp.]|uniref:hypothetical protein n=1 Tax=Thiothrix sp. TaxID=1032 RepID=UPI00260F6F04|nr:hypothetical protein [Thiothrix sp.]MDD5394899.1 hypothetical protein [Thiothrix sp.]